MGLLAHLAREGDTSLSAVAKELILDALERREDMALSLIAKMRDVERVKKIQHKDAWN